VAHRWRLRLLDDPGFSQETADIKNARAFYGLLPEQRCEQNTGWKPMLGYIGLPDCRAISQSHEIDFMNP
jgi:hypothetical protein